MFAHVVMAVIVALKINEAPFPHIFLFVSYRVPQPQNTFGINAFFNKTKKKGDHLFLNIVNNHILHPKKTEETTRGKHHL